MASAQEQQRCQGGAAGDENRGEMLVFDTRLLSGKTKAPVVAGALVRGFRGG